MGRLKTNFSQNCRKNLSDVIIPAESSLEAFALRLVTL